MEVEKTHKLIYREIIGTPFVVLGSSSSTTEKISEETLVKKLTRNTMGDLHEKYRDSSWIPDVIPYIFFDYEKSKVLLKGTTRPLINSLQHFFLRTPNGYVFDEKLKLLIRRLFEIFDIFESKKLFENFVIRPTDIYYSPEDIEFQFPRIFLNMSGSLKSSSQTSSSTPPSQPPKSSSQTLSSTPPSQPTKSSSTPPTPSQSLPNSTPLSSPPPPTPMYLSYLGDFLLILVQQTKSPHFTMARLADSERIFINGLKSDKWNLPQAQSHPILWRPGTLLRYIGEAQLYVQFRRSQQQELLNHNRAIQDSKSKIELGGETTKIQVFMGLPISMRFKGFLNGKYDTWKETVRTNCYLNAFFDASVKDGTTYLDGVGGLLAFLRNTTQHFYDVKNISTPIPAARRLKISKRVLEDIFIDLFPEFVGDIYPEMATWGFIFKEVGDRK